MDVCVHTLSVTWQYVCLLFFCWKLRLKIQTKNKCIIKKNTTKFVFDKKKKTPKNLKQKHKVKKYKKYINKLYLYLNIL